MPAQSKVLNSENISYRRLLFAIKIFSTLAILDAGYLVWVSLSGGALPGCGPSSSCQELLASRWAYFFGLPVSLLAGLVYGTFFIAALRLSGRGPALELRRAWTVLVSCSFLMIFAAIWFVCLQLFVMKKICPFCMAAHACASLAAGIVLFRAPIRPGPAKVWQVQKEVFIEPSLVKMIALASLAGLVALIAGQSLHAPRSYVVRSASSSGVAESKKVAPVVSIYDGKFQLNLEEEPLIGASTAPRVMVSLFDYTCHHCRVMHGYLMQAHRTFSNQLAIVSLPMPLDGACNRLVKRTNPMHANGCEYARIGLAVWRANRKLSAQFDDWIFAPPSPPPLVEARQYAAALVGQKAFAEALQEQWIDNEIRRDVAIYEASYLQDRKGMMPQLIIGAAFVSGPFNQLSDLYKLLSQELGLNSP